MNERLLSVLVPCYNEEDSLPLLYQALVKTAEGMPQVRWEFIFINDGSRDRTLPIVKEYHERDERVRFISFSRNFGKESAIYAGLESARGDYVVLMDADLQHPPEYIPEMYDYIAKKGYDSVAMRRISRKGEKKVRSLFSNAFYKIINKISNTNIQEGATDYRMMTRQMVDAVLSLQEYHRFTKGIFSWVGFETKWLEYENVERMVGETKWSFKSLLKYSLEGLTAFSTAPLTWASVLGIWFCLLAFLMGMIVVVKTLIWGDPVAGFPTLICVVFMIGGIQLLIMGIQGQYISKTYTEVKKRPVYVIKETEEEFDKDRQGKKETTKHKETETEIKTGIETEIETEKKKEAAK